MNVKSTVGITVDMLNDLIQIQSYRLEGYKKVQESCTSETTINNILSEGRALSYSCREYLKRLVGLYGREPAPERIFSGAFARAYIKLRSNVSKSNYKVILRELEIGEREVQAAYENALKLDSTPAFIREILILQKHKLREQQERIKGYNQGADRKYTTPKRTALVSAVLS